MDIKIKKEYEYKYLRNEEKWNMINEKSSNNDIIFTPSYSESNDCEHYHEQYCEDFITDKYYWGFSRNCKLTVINENEKTNISYSLAISSNKVDICINSETDSGHYIQAITRITLDRDLFKEEEKKYHSLKNKHNTKTLFDMIFNKIEQVISFVSEYHLFVDSLKDETDTNIDKNAISKKIRAFIDIMINKSKSIGLKDKDIRVFISMGEIMFVYDALIKYDYPSALVEWISDAYIQEEFGSVKSNVPVIQIHDFRSYSSDVPSVVQIILPELDSIVEISKIPISDNATSYKISINDTVFSISHVNITISTEDDIAEFNKIATREIYKKIVIVGDKLYLEDTTDVYNYNEQIKIYTSDKSNRSITNTTTISKYHKINDILKLYYEYENKSIKFTKQNNDEKKQTVSNTKLTIAYLNSNQDFAHKKYTVTNITEQSTQNKKDRADITFENDDNLYIKNEHAIISDCISDNTMTKKIMIEDTLR